MASQSVSGQDCAAEFALNNYTGTRFDVAVDRTVRLLDSSMAWKRLGVPPAPETNLVAYETDNQITNTGKSTWEKETGLLSIWILGMFNPSPSTTIVAPVKAGSEAELGPKITSDYFGPVPAGRLAAKDDAILFRADGKFRSKIGISPRRSRAVLGSYDPDKQVLTLVQFSKTVGVTDYVNWLLAIQEDPYAGDASNAYNDGPPTPGAKPLGPFYELESSSPAAALSPGQSLSHLHRTLHLSKKPIGTGYGSERHPRGFLGSDQNGVAEDRLNPGGTRPRTGREWAYLTVQPRLFDERQNRFELLGSRLTKEFEQSHLGGDDGCAGVAHAVQSEAEVGVRARRDGIGDDEDLRALFQEVEHSRGHTDVGFDAAQQDLGDLFCVQCLGKTRRTAGAKGGFLHGRNLAKRDGDFGHAEAESFAILLGGKHGDTEDGAAPNQKHGILEEPLLLEHGRPQAVLDVHHDKAGLGALESARWVLHDERYGSPDWGCRCVASRKR